jgi:Hg(II)-responsive transcriptional regulator
MRIGEVAAAVGCNIQTLRYYERRGLLEAPERTVAGYREYPSEAVRLIRFIKRAQDLGFTLHDVEELLKLRNGQSGRRGEVRAVAEAKMRDIETKLGRLKAVHSALKGLLESCANDRESPSCPILDALNEPEGGPASNGKDGRGTPAKL